MNEQLSAYATGWAVAFPAGLIVATLMFWLLVPDLGKRISERMTQLRNRLNPATADDEEIERILGIREAPGPEFVLAPAQPTKRESRDAAKAKEETKALIAKSPEAAKYAPPGQESRVTIGSRRQQRAAGLPLLAEDQPTVVFRTDDWKTAELDMSVARWTQEALDPEVIP